jgi:hypothetical protein
MDDDLLEIDSAACKGRSVMHSWCVRPLVGRTHTLIREMGKRLMEAALASK